MADDILSKERLEEISAIVSDHIIVNIKRDRETYINYMLYRKRIDKYKKKNEEPLGDIVVL